MDWRILCNKAVAGQNAHGSMYEFNSRGAIGGFESTPDAPYPLKKQVLRVTHEPTG